MRDNTLPFPRDFFTTFLDLFFMLTCGCRCLPAVHGFTRQHHVQVGHRDRRVSGQSRYLQESGRSRWFLAVYHGTSLPSWLFHTRSHVFALSSVLQEALETLHGLPVHRGRPKPEAGYFILQVTTNPGAQRYQETYGNLLMLCLRAVRKHVMRWGLHSLLYQPSSGAGTGTIF